MNDTIIDTINNITDTIAQVVSNQTIVEASSEGWNFLASFWGYWLPAILLISTAIFFRRFMFSNSSISYSTSFDGRDKTKDVRFRNIYVVLAILIGLCPYVNWAIIVVLIICIGATTSEDTFPFYLNKEKFFEDKLMNFLFNGEMEPTSNKKEKFKDL